MPASPRPAIAFILFALVALACPAEPAAQARQGSKPRWIASQADPSFKRIEFELLSKPARSPSRPLAQALAKHPLLPRADILAAHAPRGSPSLARGSFALPSGSGEPCAIHFAIDELGHGGIARDFYSAAEAVGGDVDPAVLDRMNEIEVLRELGHCEHARMGDRTFSHPALSAAESQALSRLLMASPGLGALHSQMFADAYAAATRIRDAAGPKARAKALLDATLLRHWRANEANIRQASMHPDGQAGRPRPSIFGNDQATSPALDELLRELPAYLEMEPGDAAALASSRALLLVAMQAVDGEREAAKAFDLDKLAIDALAEAMRELWGRQREILRARSPLPARDRAEADARAYAKLSLAGSGPVGMLLAEHGAAIASASVEHAPAWIALADSDPLRPHPYGPSATGAAERAARAAGALIGTKLAADSASFGAPPELFELARSGWAKALDAERARLGPRAAETVLDFEAGAKLSAELFPRGSLAPRKRPSASEASSRRATKPELLAIPI